MNASILTTVIIDDELEAIFPLEKLIKAITGFQVIEKITDPVKALPALLKNKPDVVFLDIQMPGLTGFEVLKLIRENDLNPYIIFTTAFDQYAIKAIRAGAFDYLLKPIDPDELSEVLKKVKSDFKTQSLQQRVEQLEKSIQNHRKLRFNTRSGYILLHPDEILYIEADANYSEIFLSKAQCEVVSMNLGAVEETLPHQFIRISRSIIINSNYLVKVSGVNKRCILKKSNEEIEFCIPEKHMPLLRKKIGEL